MSSLWFSYDPYYEWDRMFDEFGERLGRQPSGVGAGRRALEGAESPGAVRALKPRMDLHENADKNLVTATFELPGLKKEDVSIDVRDNRLTVAGESKMEKEEKDESGYAIRERRYGRFARTLQLPQGIKDADIKAKMENGVLCVTFPKAAPEQAAKRITIS
ncbi:hypothetical protein AX16_010356 [Volvariella volvacea WC 439]|nr:hypothetical protein AX16_010356 [Volvariella volvacea WC 439]